jgi:membrane protein YqaA with SNARE-associated domain
MKQIEELIFSRLPNWLIVGTLFISECFTGILPPDMYILWAKSLDYPYLMVFILALSSYVGGIISWYIGTQLHRLKRVKQWVHIKFSEQFKTFRKFGGLVIFISALTPLPFSPVSVVAGMVEYPFKNYLLVALSRFLRFFLYAFVLYKFI